MKMRVYVVAAVALGLAALGARPATAQDLAITNARVIVGNGQVIPSGKIGRAHV